MIRSVICISVAVAGCSPSPTANRQTLDEARQSVDCREKVGFFQPKDGVVATDQIAKEVGFQYLHDVFPRDELRPVSASLKNGIWHVSGYFPKGDIGGAAHVLICQSNGRVLRLWHEK